MLRTNSWMNVSALSVLAAAGTVLGTSALAAAQSAPARAQQRHIEIVTGDDDDSGPQVRLDAQGDDDDDAPRARRHVVQLKREGQNKAGQERRTIVLQGAGGESGCCGDGCCCCGGDDDGDEGDHVGAKNKQRIERRKVIRLGGGEGAQPQTWISGLPGAQGMGGAKFYRFDTPGAEGKKRAEVRVFGDGGGRGGDDQSFYKLAQPGSQAKRRAEVRMFGGGDGDQPRTFTWNGGQGTAGFFGQGSGKVVVIGPDGERHEHSFGPGQGGSSWTPGGGGDDDQPNVILRRAKPAEKDVKAKKQIELRTRQGGGAGGSGNVRGHIVIVGPDGKEQVFDFGDTPGLQANHFEPFKFNWRDGFPGGQHLFFTPGDDGQAGPGHEWRIQKRPSPTCEAM